MKKSPLFLSVLVFLFTSPCFSELHLFDADNHDLGVFIGHSPSGGMGFRLGDYVIYNPDVEYMFSVSASSDRGLAGDVAQPSDVFYEQKDCTGSAYSSFFVGIKHGLLRIGKKYYKTTPVTGTVTIRSMKSLKMDDTDKYGSCGNIKDPWKFDSMSQLSPVEKPLLFLPATLPFKIMDR